LTNYRTQIDFQDTQLNGLMIGSVLRFLKQGPRYSATCKRCGTVGFADQHELVAGSAQCRNQACRLFGVTKPAPEPEIEKPSEAIKRITREQALAEKQALIDLQVDRDNYRHYYFIEALWLQKSLADVLTLEQWKQLPQDIRNRLTVESRKWKQVTFPNGGFAYEWRDE
jgi:hypothetical protein